MEDLARYFLHGSCGSKDNCGNESSSSALEDQVQVWGSKLPTFNAKQLPPTPIPRGTVTGPIVNKEAGPLGQDCGLHKNFRQNRSFHIALGSKNSKDLGPLSYKKKNYR